ncbi:MAG: EAL domain-containing protein [Proteobacteria bacterium]|nr:EAL domain-containing protein [Pseudomonadota bacterium]
MLVELAKGVALLLALSLLQGFVRRKWRSNELAGQLVSGGLFGSICVIGMLAPIHFLPGVIFDARSVVISIAGLFGGPITGGIAAFITGGYRLWVGGSGAPVGLAVIVSCLALGLAYRHGHRKGWVKTGFIQYLVFGFIVHLVSVVLFLFLPPDIAQKVLSNVSLPLIITFTPATALLGMLLLDIEKRMETDKALHDSEDRYKSLFENSEVSIWNQDFSAVIKALGQLRQDGVSDLRQYLGENQQLAWDMAKMVKVKHVNRATLKLFKASSEQQLLDSIDTVFGPETIDVFIDQLCAFWKQEKVFYSDTTQKTLDGDILNVIITMPIPETDEGYQNIPVSIVDVTERKLAEEELKKLWRAVECSSAIVIITDLKGIIEYVNPRFTEITGYTSDEAIGQTPRMLNSGKQSKAFYADLWKTILSGKEWKGEMHNRKKDGSLYWDRSSISGVRDADGNITHFIAIKDDVTQEYELTEQLSYQASHDALTGLVNRREFEQRANRLLATIQHDQADHAMCFLDLDRFKVINDTCGHPAGDELLRQLGKLLQTTVRKRDTLARLGGDEFGVLMEHCSLDQAQRVADAILQAIKDYQFFWEGEVFRIGASIGLVAITEATGNFTELFKQADAACYLAKDQGRNRIHTYHPEDTELAARHGEMQWVGRIDQALEDDRFCLYAQPIVALDGGKQRHYELLLRMLDEQGKIIPPGAFLPAAERYNLIEKLDLWVLNHACAFLAEPPAFVEQIDFVSINLSGPSLTNKEFLETILRNFSEYRVSPGKICFEITETVAVSNLESAASFISTLQQVGCRFALDDFGSGLSSFGYLKRLPVDYLKIDGMFVKGIVDDPIDYAMVRSINEIGQLMGMQTIAEFVENDEIRAKLKTIGVNYGQGYALGKPQPLEELLDSSMRQKSG